MATLDTEQFTEIFPFFRNSSKTLVKDILLLSRESFTSRNTALQLEGQPCTHLELMLAGDKRIFKSSPEGKEITLYEIGPGETCIINSICALSNTASPVNVKAITDVSSLLIPARGFRNLVAGHEDMRAFIFHTINQEISAILELLGGVAFEKTNTRLFNYLVEKSENGLLCTTHQQIADGLGTAREVVSRLLKDFEKSGKVILSRGRIQLLTAYWDN